ncbi:hypothetical protein RUM43_000855 [Polyplax serrata]|uniref:Carboxylesterase type B domain-containing protein n=1 Tax=Polyplax serrata TaxID=468196 RepID=A0AAN8XNQ3_POLSC
MGLSLKTAEQTLQQQQHHHHLPEIACVVPLKRSPPKKPPMKEGVNSTLTGNVPIMSTRIVETRYGKLQGMIYPMDHSKHLKPVEVFLGVPYATPPVRSNRFSPTRTPSPWEGIRIADKMGPVCPQKLPGIKNETAALEKMPKGRLEYLKRLLPYLKNQSEDCLYLNIYSPAQEIEEEEVKRNTKFNLESRNLPPGIYEGMDVEGKLNEEKGGHPLDRENEEDEEDEEDEEVGGSGKKIPSEEIVLWFNQSS